MAKATERKCNACKQSIKINKNDIHDVVYYKKLYYHSECFVEIATKRSQSKSKTAAEWNKALAHIGDFEADAKTVLSTRLVYQGALDDLNDYLLSKYKVVSIPGRFWQVLADLNNGIYRSKRCNKVTTDVVLETWKWAQRDLDDIDRGNRLSHRGPTGDEQRLSYDFAIVVRRIPDFLAYKAKREAAEAETKLRQKETVNIDYSKIKVANNNEGLDDISNLLDDLI